MKILPLLGTVLSILCAVSAGVAHEVSDRPYPFDVEEVSTTVKDSERGRSIHLLVVFPVQAEAPSPLIILTHGFLLTGEGYRSYAVHMAAHGLVVALPTLQMSLFSMHHGELARDVAFVIEACLQAGVSPGHPLESRIDAERIGVAGHSLGGKLSLMAALIDPRISAAVLLDPVDSGSPAGSDAERYPSIARERMQELSIPLLFLGAELGGVRSLLMPCAPIDENYQRFFDAAQSPAVEITQLGVGHAQYVDEGSGQVLLRAACAAGHVPDEEVRATSAAYMTLFFLASLSDDQQALSCLESRWVSDEAAGRIAVRRK